MTAPGRPTGQRHRECSVPEFEGDRHRLGLYHRALSGSPCELQPYDSDADLWQHPDTKTTLRLPSQAPVGDSAVRPGTWYRVATTHRALHQACGTWDLDLSRSEVLFVRRRPDRTHPGVPDLEYFVRQFGRTALVIEVFSALEDLRIDVLAQCRLPGLAEAYRAVMRAALRDRPEPAALPPRAAVAETLVRYTLGAETVVIGSAARAAVCSTVAVAARLADRRATVESTAEATLRVYTVLSSLPNVAVDDDTTTTVHLPTAAVEGQAALHDLPVATGEELRLEGDELLDVRFVPVRFRDVPGPRYAGQATSGMPLREAILRMTPLDADPHGQEGPDADEHGFVDRSLQAERGDVDVTATDRPAGPPEPLPHDHGPDLEGHHEGVSGSLRARVSGEFVYPEWDHVAGRYLRDWCLVRVREPQPRTAGATAAGRALARSGRLVPSLVRELERMLPDGRDLALRQPYGDDLDLDACVDALVDLRAGAVPHENVFSAFVEQSRDVAVAIAVDLSSSTAERLDSGKTAEGPTRILDLQRDAVALLAEALERVGDSYGIYGFSGTGRDDCRLTVVKEMDETRSALMLRRLDGLRPDHTTRMAPTIRHLTRRLEAQPVATRVLLVVSDGRPFDFDYGHQYGDDGVLDYALADTARALDEARDRGVCPYLVTVDPEGGDYLRTICHPTEYHVIADARDLPSALGKLYLVARRRAFGARRTALPEVPSPT